MLTKDYQNALLDYLNSEIPLQRILYDINLLPECCLNDYQAHFMFGMIAMYRQLKDK